MANSLRFTCTALTGTGKKGILQMDANGYRKVALGALNVYNSAGEFYLYEQCKELFASSGALMRRVKRGVLKAELGHPKPLPGQSEESYMLRIQDIDQKNVAAHIKEVSLNFNDMKDAEGRPIIGIEGWVKGSGPHGDSTEKSLDNPDENTCFSIRAFTDNFRNNGRIERVLKQIVTWDVVTEPGIATATKWDSPGLESYFEHDFSRSTADAASRILIANPALATESNTMNFNELMGAMGWEPNRSDVPAFMKW